MRWTLEEIAIAVSPDGADGGVGGKAADVEIQSVTIDSRSVRGGELFVPIIAERDGHDFVSSAIDAGAAAYLRSGSEVDDRAPSIPVSDTSSALLRLGHAARTRIGAHVVGVTGSVGKTSVKDLIRSVCAQHVVTHANRASFNNELGVPLTLLDAPDDAGVVVIEMGARNVGHIELLCGIAQPTIGVITAVAAVHTEIFGSIDQVAQAKGELAAAIPADGTLVLNADDPNVLAMSERSATSRVLTYGKGPDTDDPAPSDPASNDIGPDINFSDVVLGEGLCPEFLLSTPIGEARVQLGVAGAHMAQNAAAAAAVGVAVGVPLDRIVAGLSSPVISPLRMDVQLTSSGATVINDSYNANPTSMAAALDALGEVKADRRIAVLGLMGELGATEAEDHRRIAERAAAAGIDTIAVDAPMYGPAATHVNGVDEAVRQLGPLGPTDAVLVKGSRSAGMERVAEALLGGESE